MRQCKFTDECDKAFAVVTNGGSYTSASVECALDRRAPDCAHRAGHNRAP